MSLLALKVFENFGDIAFPFTPHILRGPDSFDRVPGHFAEIFFEFDRG
jgi:hypothetical protein